MNGRDAALDAVSRNTYDVAVIGGGVNGASLHHRLRREGYDAIVLERGDFASGTSQASGMMIWGGLLYLRNFDLPSVVHFSRARERMIHGQAGSASPLVLRFVPAASGRLGKAPAMAALYFYWLLGRGRRRWPRVESSYDERARLASPRAALCFEEAMLVDSDSRFVLRWLARRDHETDVAALNYAQVIAGAWCATERLWRLEVRDSLTGREITIGARAVANCAGAWTDRVNARFGVRSPWRHVFSKGVYLVFERAPEQRAGLVLEMGVEDDIVTSVPWGPVELWGPTETSIGEPEEGLRATPEDVAFLLELRARRLRDAGSRDAIVALRCGVRPLAVPAAHAGGRYPLDLSRRPRIVADRERPWVSVYGGKLTGCAEAAGRAMRALRRHVAPSGSARLRRREEDGNRTGSPGPGPLPGAPGLANAMPTPAWCRDREFACTLEDYLRRRTNWAQWVPRGGLGRHDEHLERVRRFAVELAGGDTARARLDLDRYRARVADEFDRVLTRV